MAYVYYCILFDFSQLCTKPPREVGLGDGTL